MALLDTKFYHPRRTTYARPEDFELAYEDVVIRTADDEHLHGWWFPGRGHIRGTVVHCHGNAGNVTYHFGHTRWLPSEGYNVLCFDYRGYGKSGGRPSREGTIRDAHAALDHVMTRSDADPGRVLLFGQSLGGAVALVAAAERDDLAGVAVDSPFSDYREEALWMCQRQWYTWAVAGWVAKWGFSRGYDPIDYVDQIAPTPLYLFHGEQDRICPTWMSQDLFDKAREPKLIWRVPDMDHDEALHLLPDIARPRLVQFFNECVEQHLECAMAG